ncbi:MAG: hypothetical protein HFJ22_02175 [Clostridia bacterium]|jgi:hypothetical protein|nr:hypothetical protein [Clostridia bacterium]
MSRRLRRKIHKWLEEQDPIRKQSLLESIIEELEIEVETEQNSTAFMSRKRKRILNMTAALAICAAVLLIVWLPIALIDRGEKPPFDRYCLSSELSSEELEMNFRDYCEQSNLSCLYLDKYDTSFVQTVRYHMINDINDTVYWHEYMMDLETGDEIDYYVTNKNTEVDFLENLISTCKNNNAIQEISIYYYYSDEVFIGTFLNQDYTYYIKITYPSSEEILFDVVEQMLETARA